jgi:chromosome segregation protein
MFLQKIEIQGFKSFANKTLMEFPDPAKGQSITSIVGPNGSGKSCVADGIRWVLGEQSLKLLRGKKSTDVIFSGSEKKARSGFAEVTIYLDNSDKRAAVDYTELAIGRRLYQNGENEYFLNKNKTRLQDIIMLLAQASFGQRAYSVIGQGMVDAVLSQTPRERREFFDEAAGVRQFQIKRQSSLGKLHLTEENLKQVEVLLNEVRPRLRTLSRHVSRLEQFDELKIRLHSLEHSYYGTLWHRLERERTAQKEKVAGYESRLAALNGEIAVLQKQFEQKETKENASSELVELQSKYGELVNKKNILREKEYVAREKIAAFRFQAQAAKKDVPTTAIILEIDQILENYLAALDKLKDGVDIASVKSELEAVYKSLDGLNKKIKNPGGDFKMPKDLEEIVASSAATIREIDAEIGALQAEMNKMREKQKEEQSEFFSVQKKWRDKVEEKNTAERAMSDLKVDLARIETKKESLETDMETHLKERKELILATPPETAVEPASVESEMQQLRYQLELIGNIDPETIKEYKETKDRFEFLETQSADLTAAISQLKELIHEMDEKIKVQFDVSFKKINADFGKFFAGLFGGGRASLEIIELESADASAATSEPAEGEEDEEAAPVEEHEKNYGIEIIANPPGKKVKAVGMLSGGERAMTSIALICAIISNNPSPFVVLDEVDAALDESNSIRFAEIVKQLAGKTQFVVITHNRSTMSIADLLYGVTMGEDGVSQLLSLKLEEAEGLVNR